MFRRSRKGTSSNPSDKCHCPEGKHANHRDISENDIHLNDVVPGAVAEICRFFISANERLARLDGKLTTAIDTRKEDLEAIEACVNTTADCQKYTAKLANQNFERHALHPSIEAVDSLTDIIIQMSRQADTLMKNQPLDASLAPLLRSITEAGRIAESKRDQLDIESIRPDELDALDTEKHTIVTAVTTNDKEKHKKIRETLTAGLIYRDKVLRHARVSVYRFSDKKVVEQENRKPECQQFSRERNGNENVHRNR